MNYGLWVIVMCQFRFISCNKRTTLVGDVDNGVGVMYVWGWENYLYFPLNLNCSKNKGFFKKNQCNTTMKRQIAQQKNGQRVGIQHFSEEIHEWPMLYIIRRKLSQCSA